mmetsp:Transcript_7944/g.12291  ORF Transcript_7944/g.12291 Transcript_7944/m.12291 type:complete len:145 (+) Transcript_7944:705-1139(+)|eukprot:CAMPEP_0170511164 /NCGR_PEP_ID=MMETSP0208-20121228/66154_1 /TAXON_ID=197538 /ORGANISM="Strombidium inclinatum, Strain S3" /LENGTH=144 /DNA_ID=CAMNT_0010794677 /DNA_START=433 /DNA_END=867 /DNA_ORIENTATION=+
MPGEQKVNLVKPHSYDANYVKDEGHLKKSVGKIVEQIGQTSIDVNSIFLKNHGTYFNTHTEELVEGFTNPDLVNDEGFGIKDFFDKMVLRFKNEHEVSLYFDAIDQLCKIIVLKGQKVLLEKEHYGSIMEDFLELSKSFMLFLA